MSDRFISHFVTAPDGLRLHVRAYGPRTAPAPAVVCLPGLARSSADFHALATVLAGDAEQPRRVIAIDYRGRGRSDYDRDAGNYSVTVELADVVAVLTALEIAPAVFLGTSRGGILTTLLAAVRPTAMAGVVLNDIGPVIDIRGLMRIKSYVGKLPQPSGFDDAAEMLRRLFDAQFPKLAPDDWLAFAQRTFVEKDGRLTADYDPKLANTLASIDPARPLPPLWREFEALAGVPLMVIRGANSDLLAPATVADMRARRPDLEFLEVPDQGHAPLLVEAEIIARIGMFVGTCSGARQ
jgi:pimeloyl-ACP methyl ester carboxylesterase